MEEKIYKRALAICIPTYNRRYELEENIQSLLPQLTPDILPLVEIHIFDNASPDNTQEYCTALAGQYDFIHYHRRPENIGPDRNFLGILASDIDAQFYHLMSDDDLFAPDSVANLVKFLDGNRDCGFVYLNVAFFWEKKFDSTAPHKLLQESAITSAKLSKKQFVNYVGEEISFLSGLVFNRNFIDLTEMENYIGSNWLQSYVFFNSTKDCEGRLGFFSQVTIAQRLGTAVSGYDPVKVFGINYYNLYKFGYEKCGYDRKQLMKIVAHSVAFQIYRQKYQGKKRKEYQQLLDIAKAEKMRFPLLVSRAPNFVAKAFHAYQQRKKRRANKKQGKEEQ